MEVEDILRIKGMVAQLSPSERDYYLHQFLAQTNRLQTADREVSAADLLNGYVNLYEDLLHRTERRQLRQIHPACTHIHMVFGDSQGGIMQMVLESTGVSERQKIIVLRENYAIGPLDLDTEEGRALRSTWLENNIAEHRDYYSEQSDLEQEYNRLLDQIGSIPPQSQIIIWADDNEVEEIGLRHAVSLLQEMPNPIVLCNPCALAEEKYALDHPGAQCEYRYSGELGLRQIEYALQHRNDSAVLSSQYKQQLAAEWREISSQQSVLRILDEGQIRQVAPDYFDQDILQRLDTVSKHSEDGQYEFCRAARVIGEVYGCSDRFIGDVYYEYRLREMIYSGVLEVQGIPAGMRYYSVRRKV
ncbi:DUF1835 domain-containing protein [Paenibacillus sp. Z6-24]